MSEMSETEQPTPEDLQDCGGCSLPPLCNEDGSAPVPYPPCSCGCNEGVELAGGVCNENGCIVPNGSTGE